MSKDTNSRVHAKIDFFVYISALASKSLSKMPKLKARNGINLLHNQAQLPKICNTHYIYRISSYSFRGNYSFLNLEIQRSQYIRPKVTVHKGAETIQGRKVFKGGNYMRKYGICISLRVIYVKSQVLQSEILEEMVA